MSRTIPGEVMGGILVVDVTAEDILAGKRHDTTNCAIAVAMKRMGLKDVEVGGWDIFVGRTRFEVASDAKAFQDDFDFGRPVSPATFVFTEVRS